MTVKYYKDYRHNYMILKCEQEEFSKSYSCNILTSNKVKGILPCSVRYINREIYLYYDISACTTLSSLFQSKKMAYEQVKDLLQQLHKILSEMSALFMEETGLVLSPDHLFYHMESKSYFGVFYPKETEENQYGELMEFLLAHIDTEDGQLADKVYQIYEMSEENYFVLEEALHILDRYEPLRKSGGGYDAPKPAKGEIFDTLKVTKEGVYDTLPEMGKEGHGRFGTVEETKEIKEESVWAKKKKQVFYLVFAVLAGLGGAATAAVRYFFELSEKEQYVLWGCVGVMGGCFIFCLYRIFQYKQSERSETLKSASLSQDFAYEEAEVSLEQVISTDMEMEMLVADYGLEEGKRGQKENGSAQDELLQGAGSNTVFFDRNSMTEYKLYALDKKNKKHIELTRFPYTVGKLAGYVDFVLSDDSVSRIHAKFDRQGDTILLTDLNSTNGTFKNGLRMQPQETVEIEAGDEIRFGKVNYCYR